MGRLFIKNILYKLVTPLGNKMMQDENELWCIVLTSQAKKGITPEGIAQVIDSTRTEQKTKGLTGLVIYARGKHLAIIEGIKRDATSYFNLKVIHPIHHDINKIHEGAIPRRFFGEYSLAIKIIGSRQLKKFDSFKLLSDKQHFENFLKIEHPVPKLVKYFIENL